MRALSVLMLVLAGSAAAQRPMPIVQNAVLAGPVTRTAIEEMQRVLNAKLETTPKGNPFNLLVYNQGVYLPGYGVVFTSELFLVNHPALSPFRKAPGPEEIARLHQANMERMPLLKQAMREMLMIVSQKLPSLPPKENITISIALSYHHYEDRKGLPGQVVVQVPCQAVLDYQSNRITLAQFDQAVKVQEF